MRLNGYIEHIDLGIDPESGEKNILVNSQREFFKLTEEERCRAWAVVKVASQILEKPAITLYQQAYKNKIPSNVFKKNAANRHGLTLLKVYDPLKDRETKRTEDKEKILRTLEKSLKRAAWIPSKQQLLIKVRMGIALRNLERELFGDEAKGGKQEGNNEQPNS
jgi:hypothetical protein